MPIFEYKCGDCGALTEFLEAVKSKKKHLCEKCGGADMKKMLSTFAPMAKQRGDGGKCDSCPEHKCPYSS
jgi:putative FmdB family regulatory protein